jgi:hypothetical protein
MTDKTFDPAAAIEAASQALTAAANLTEGATDDDGTCLKDEGACFRINPVHFAWYQLGETGVIGETKAIARVAVEAAHKPLLDALAAAREELAEVTRELNAFMHARIQGDDMAARVTWLSDELVRVEAERDFWKSKRHPDVPAAAPQADEPTSGSVIWCNRCLVLVGADRLDEHNARSTHRALEPRPLSKVAVPGDGEQAATASPEHVAYVGPLRWRVCAACQEPWPCSSALPTSGQA